MKQKLFIFVVLSVLLSGVGFCGDSSDKIPQLAVTGKATLYKPADQLTLSIGVVTQDADVEKALTENSKKMESMIEAIGKVGITKSEYHTGHFTVRPIYTQPPRERPEDWVARIKEYEVVNSLEIKTENLQAAGAIISAANKAGANSIDNILFGLKDPREYRDEVIKDAVAVAVHDAKQMADAAGVSLLGVMKISLDQPQFNPFRVGEAPVAMFKNSGDGGTPIEPGNVEVTAQVMIIYEIK